MTICTTFMDISALHLLSFLPVNIISHIVDVGSAYGTAQSGCGIASMGVLRPDLIIKSVVPVVMAGILGIYGLIISVIINQKSTLVELSKFYSWICR